MELLLARFVMTVFRTSKRIIEVLECVGLMQVMLPSVSVLVRKETVLDSIFVDNNYLCHDLMSNSA
jgi:hypothetical protein